MNIYFYHVSYWLRVDNFWIVVFVRIHSSRHLQCIVNIKNLFFMSHCKHKKFIFYDMLRLVRECETGTILTAILPEIVLAEDCTKQNRILRRNTNNV